MTDVKLDENGNVIDESSTPKEEEKTTVPYERFKEVNDKMRNLETEIQGLKSQKDESGLNTEQKKELEAKEYLKGLLKETLTEQKDESTKEEQAQQEKFDKDVADILSVNTEVKKDDFLKFVEKEADTYGISSVEGAMLLFRKINNIKTETAEDTRRDIDKKPGIPSTEGGGGGSKTPETDKGKSLNQIADEVTRDL
ncbi:hypothetical protein LCGC14_2580320 [marine sediment metagenome]|uniref:Scaffolding protein n=1 Tax=marine sediment metagenome TaxID=412755 RepID=A0A0F9AF03_9ZZZZ